MLLTVVPIRRNSPRTGRPSISRAIFCDRSPRATAVMTRATSLVGATKSEMSWFTEDIPPAHAPLAGPTEARSCILPSRPTTLPTRTSSPVMCSFIPMMSLSSSPTRPRTPSFSYGNRIPKSPCLTALSTSTRCSISVRLAGERRSHSVTGTAVLSAGFATPGRPRKSLPLVMCEPWPFLGPRDSGPFSPIRALIGLLRMGRLPIDCDSALSGLATDAFRVARHRAHLGARFRPTRGLRGNLLARSRQARFERCQVLAHRARIPCYGFGLEALANRADLGEAVADSVARHVVSEPGEGLEIAVLERGDKGGEVAPSMLQKTGK